MRNTGAVRVKALQSPAVDLGSANSQTCSVSASYGQRQSRPAPPSSSQGRNSARLIRATLAASVMPSATVSARWGQAYRMGLSLRCVVTAEHCWGLQPPHRHSVPPGTASVRRCGSEHHRHGGLTPHSSAVRPHPAGPCSTHQPSRWVERGSGGGRTNTSNRSGSSASSSSVSRDCAAPIAAALACGGENRQSSAREEERTWTCGLAEAQVREFRPSCPITALSTPVASAQRVGDPFGSTRGAECGERVPVICNYP
jgi:hypothetical protein